MPKPTGRATAAKSTKKAAPAAKKKAAPAKKTAPAKKAAAKKAPAKKKAAAAKRSAPVKKAPAAKKAAAPGKKATPAAKKATPVKKAAPVKKAPAAPAVKKKAPAPAAVKRKAVAPPPAPAKKAAPPPKKTVRLPEKFLEEMKAALIEERAEYLHQAESLRAEADLLAADREPGDVQFDEESGEGDTLAVERERDLALSAQAQQAIEEIDVALLKIVDATYGICTQCGELIPRERLRALPHAALCVTCKSGGLGWR